MKLHIDYSMLLILIMIIIIIKLVKANVLKQSCTSDGQCKSANAVCDKQQHKCVCDKDYVKVGSLVNDNPNTNINIKSSSNDQSVQLTPSNLPACLIVAKLDEPCISHQQCIVKFSVCSFESPKVSWFKTNKNESRGQCKCKVGYQKQDENDLVKVESNYITVPAVCIHNTVHNGNTWLFTFSLVCLLLLILLIGCFICIIRLQKWKQRNFGAQLTMTSVHAGGGGHHGPGGHHLATSSPPPMGSAEAEFQNDFIQVFPMHHLEPLPDKNSHHYVIK